MKKLIYLFLFLSIGLSSCEFYYLEPVYPERDRLIGRHDLDEYSETYNVSTSYSIWIERSSRYANEFYIDNFYGVDIRVCATISNGKITIHRQVVDGYEVEGVGTVYGSEISLSYSVNDLYSDTRTDFCEATAW
jgi:hypothetical protein